MTLRIAVVIATRGRGPFLHHVLRYLSAQTRKPDIVCISGVDESDVVSADADHSLELKIVFGPPGLPAQRNTGVRAVLDTSDVIVFFDDDFLPARRWLEQLEKIFESHPKVMGIDGTTLADGAKGSGIAVEDGARLLQEYEHGKACEDNPLQPRRSLYGWNMAYRSEIFETLLFDNRLPLYGWLEDKDFSSRVSMQASLANSKDLIGVHLGIKQGRLSGLKFGISQVINPAYLFLKGTLGTSEAVQTVVRSILKNFLRAFWSESYIDRRGRLLGNVVGLCCLISGRIDPGVVARVKL